MTEFGKIFIIVGVFFVFLGLLMSGKAGFLGRLPGDILVQKNNFTFYFPLATSILLSIIISLIFYFFKK